MICKNCGAQLEEGASFCTVCGAKVEAEVQAQPQPQPQPQFQAQPQPQYQAQPQYQQPRPQVNIPAAGAPNATPALVFGIIGISLACFAACFCAVPFLNFIFAIIGVIFSGIALGKAKAYYAQGGVPSGKVKTGKILGTIGLICSIILIVVGVIVTILWIVAAATGALKNIQYNIDFGD